MACLGLWAERSELFACFVATTRFDLLKSLLFQFVLHCVVLVLEMFDQVFEMAPALFISSSVLLPSAQADPSSLFVYCSELFSLLSGN